MKAQPSTGEDSPDPAGEVLEEPRLPAADLQREIGDSEAWDEANEETDDTTPELED